MRKVLVKDITKELNNLIQTRTEDVIYCIHEQPLVFKSNYGEINKQYCIDNNYIICESQNMGGIIVANTGDINMAIMKNEGWNVGNDLLIYLKEKLQNKIPYLVVDSNDLLADGKYKMISYASINANNRLVYTCVHISFNPDVNAIQNICMKPMTKIPKGLKEYGITHDEIIEYIRSFIETY
jgi:hypothetical protein